MCLPSTRNAQQKSVPLDASRTTRARFLFDCNLLLLRGFSASLLGISLIKQRLLLALSLVGSHHHHIFSSGSHIKKSTTSFTLVEHWW